MMCLDGTSWSVRGLTGHSPMICYFWIRLIGFSARWQNSAIRGMWENDVYCSFGDYFGTVKTFWMEWVGSCMILRLLYIHLRDLWLIFGKQHQNADRFVFDWACELFQFPWSSIVRNAVWQSLSSAEWMATIATCWIIRDTCSDRNDGWVGPQLSFMAMPKLLRVAARMTWGPRMC